MNQSLKTKKNENTARALDKMEYLVTKGLFLLILHKTICCTPHLNRLDETVQIRGHNIW